MNRTRLNFYVDLLGFLAMLALAATGAILYFVLPPGTGHSHALFGLGRHDYGSIHSRLAAFLLAIVALHLILHWHWACFVTARLLGITPPHRPARLVAGVLVVLASVAGLASAAWLSAGRVVPHPEQDRHVDHRRDDCPRGTVLDGRSTLQDAADAAGLTPSELGRRLGLPAGVGPGERLGRLRRRHGFTIDEVRGYVCDPL